MKNSDPHIEVPSFDHNAENFSDTWPEVYHDLRASCPVAHSQRYGGFYIVSRYEDCLRVARDHESFSSEHDVDGTGNGGGGNMIPPSNIRIAVLEMDPPESLRYRKLLASWLTARTIDRFEPRMRQLANDVMDRIGERQQFDAVDDYANPLPAVVTLDFMGLPLDNWELYARAIHELIYIDRQSPEFSRVNDDLALIQRDMLEIARERRSAPRDDFTSFLISAELDGKPLSDEAIAEILFMLLNGGLDTTTAVLASGLRWLGAHPEARIALRSEPGILPTACDEFLRHFAPSMHSARTVIKKAAIGEVTLEPGDRVLLAWGSANRDERVFEDPDYLDLQRTPNRHLTFGNGVHQCIGQNFARTELRVAIDEFLRRYPDFTVDEPGTQHYPSVGMINGYSAMPITVSPHK